MTEPCGKVRAVTGSSFSAPQRAAPLSVTESVCSRCSVAELPAQVLNWSLVRLTSSASGASEDADREVDSGISESEAATNSCNRSCRK